MIDCRHFKGNAPCFKNKETGVICDSCNSYDKIESNILIIKLEAIGDVIRTTPILHKLKSLYPTSRIYWLTLSPEILPKDYIDCIMEFNFKSVEILKTIKFDFVFNLDKSLEACALANSVNADIINKKGYGLSNGVPFPFNMSARHKYITGISDACSKSNTKHYVEEIFDICDIGKFNEEPYILPNGEKGQNDWWIDKTKTVIGLNTGCGERWPSRLWPTEYWEALAMNLIQLSYEVVLLGGEIEDDKNYSIHSSVKGTKYFGFGPFSKFIDLVDNCDLIVSQVTSAAHIAIGLKKKIVLMNNIFNPNEFYLYGLGKIIEPNDKCECFYLPECKKDNHCMKSLSVDKVLQTIVDIEVAL